MGSRITLTSNEIKDIIKIIRYSKNRGILLKGNAKQAINQKGGFLCQLMRVDLPLTKTSLIPLAEIVFIPLGLTSGSPATDATIQKKFYGLCVTTLVISNKKRKISWK